MFRRAFSLILMLLVFFSVGTSVASTKVSGSDLALATIGGTIDDFDYVIEKKNIRLKKYHGVSSVVIIEATYEVDGKKYNTDLTDFQFGIGNKSVKAVYISEGIKELEDSIFNSSDVKKVYLPKSMKVISTRLLGYLNPDEGEKIEVFYPGKQKEFEKKLTDKSGSPKKSKAAEKGAEWANKFNNFFGLGYDPENFDFIFEATIEDFLGEAKEE